MDTDKQAELEKHVANLAAEVASLKRIIVMGVGALVILFVMMFIAPGFAIIAATIGLVVCAAVYVLATLGSALSRRAHRKKQPHIV